VESSGNNLAVGDKGKAVGALQIHPVMVEDINRILKLKKSTKTYTLEDRKDRAKSIQMASIFFQHYVKDLRDYETMARAWNGGPGWRKNKTTTNRYWSKVSAEMRKAL
jgi:hypothetical protein